ncbi:MAG: Ig-like domain-containing protein [Clostridium sp.]|nr:Ig-like domain-containing protein [Clostridium sp.]
MKKKFWQGKFLQKKNETEKTAFDRWEESEDESGEYYAEEADGYYADSEEEADEPEEYYADSEEEEADEYFIKDGPEEADETEEYYADSEEEADEYFIEDGSEEADETEEYYAGDGSEETDEPEEYYADSEEISFGEYGGEGLSRRKAPRPPSAGTNLFQKLWLALLEMGMMDRVILVAGAAVLLVAVFAGIVFLNRKIETEQLSGFVSVGWQLDGIDLPGEAGLLAVADAQQARIAAANAVLQEPEEEPEETEYEEGEYSTEVTVAMNMTSIEKDLKIKFVNQKTGKLIPNVAFRVSVTDPDGKTAEWRDDDKDGIIYQTGILPGVYRVSVLSLEGEQYAAYILPSDRQTVEVKKEIAYAKVDVSDEVKLESEVNVAQEDTEQKEIPVESALKDTVAWVASAVAGVNYVEIDKKNIPDPTTLALAGKFLRLAEVGSLSGGSKTLTVDKSFTVSAPVGRTKASNDPWSSSDSTVATVDSSSGKVTGIKAGTAEIWFEAQKEPQDVSPGDQTEKILVCTVTVTAPPKGSLTVAPTSVTLAAGGSASVQATPAGFSPDKLLVYNASSSNPGIATAAADTTGKVSIQGVTAGEAKITVTADYQVGGADTQASATVAVTVVSKKSLALDKNAATVYLDLPVTIKATVTNAATADTPVTAESSDPAVATVAVKGKEVTITGVKAGTATVTVKYLEYGEEVKAACTVTVKINPKNDTVTALKDTSGNPLYVLEGGTYREARYADYYKADKFFVRGDATYTGWQTLDGKVYFFDAGGKKVTGEQVIQGAKYHFASDGSLVVGSGTSGIDVSKWNGAIDWNAVKNSGIAYVIIRCGYRGSTQGALIRDPMYDSNIKGAIAAGLKVGVYFFTQAVNGPEAVEEASMVLDMVKNYKISYPIFLDVESSGGRADGISKEARTAVCKAFCETIKAAGYTSGIYANKTWLGTKIDAASLGAYKIWLAQYAAAPSYTGRYDLWQYKSNGRVSGISGDVDMNLSYLGY